MKQLADLLGRIASLMVGVVVKVGLAIVAWVLWQGYDEARLQSRFEPEGQIVGVKVTDANCESRSWRDTFGNVACVSFLYRAKSYTARFASDTLWVSSGDRLWLLYHPQFDAFRQPVAAPRAMPATYTMAYS